VQRSLVTRHVEVGGMVGLSAALNSFSESRLSSAWPPHVFDQLYQQLVCML